MKTDAEIIAEAQQQQWRTDPLWRDLVRRDSSFMEALVSDCEDAIGFHQEARTRWPAALAEIERLREALRYYADQENYRYPTGREMCEDHCFAAKPIDADDGERARSALTTPPTTKEKT